MRMLIGINAGSIRVIRRMIVTAAGMAETGGQMSRRAAGKVDGGVGSFSDRFGHGVQW